jgi:hypothetical protein
MQPNTQASLAPGRDDIRHLRAEQEFCGVIGCFDLVTAKAQRNLFAGLQPTLSQLVVVGC